MKKHIGSKLALYPTTLVVVGTMVNGKPNWTLVGHLGIIGHDRVMVSLAKPHYTNQGIKASGTRKRCLSTLWMRPCCKRPTMRAASAV